MVAPVTFVKLNALGVLLFVATDHVPDTVVPAVTVAVTGVFRLPDEVSRMAMESPAENPLTVVPPQTPLRAMAVQLAPHVALTMPVKLLNVTALLLTVVLVLTPV